MCLVIVIAGSSESKSWKRPSSKTQSSSVSENIPHYHQFLLSPLAMCPGSGRLGLGFHLILVKSFQVSDFLDDSGEFTSFKAVNLKRNRSKKLCLPLVRLGDSFSGKSLLHHSNSLSKSILALKRWRLNDFKRAPFQTPRWHMASRPITYAVATHRIWTHLDFFMASSLQTQSIQTDKRSYLDKSVLDVYLKQEPIAIVGMAVNMPGAPNVGQLWEILVKGSNTVDEVRFEPFILSLTWLTWNIEDPGI